MRRYPIIALSVLAVSAGGFSIQISTARADSLQNGHQSYQAGDYETALKHFLDAQIDRPNSPVLDLHLGNTYYKMERYDKAADAYTRALRTDHKHRRSGILYDLGNTAYQQGKLKQAIEYYNQSLDINPDDEDAKHNLELVREKLRQMIEQQKKQQQQKKNQQCSNPQEQKQPGEQQGQQEQRAEQQQKRQEEQASERAGQREKQQQGRQQPQQPEADQQQKRQQAGAQPQPPEQRGQDSGSDRARALPRPGDRRPLSKEEAEQLLRRLQEQPPKPNIPAGKRYRPGKDW